MNIEAIDNSTGKPIASIDRLDTGAIKVPFGQALVLVFLSQPLRVMVRGEKLGAPYASGQLPPPEAGQTTEIILRSEEPPFSVTVKRTS